MLEFLTSLLLHRSYSLHTRHFSKKNLSIKLHYFLRSTAHLQNLTQDNSSTYQGWKILMLNQQKVSVIDRTRIYIFLI